MGARMGGGAESNKIGSLAGTRSSRLCSEHIYIDEYLVTLRKPSVRKTWKLKADLKAILSNTLIVATSYIQASLVFKFHTSLTSSNYFTHKHWLLVLPT